MSNNDIECLVGEFERDYYIGLVRYGLDHWTTVGAIATMHKSRNEALDAVNDYDRGNEAISERRVIRIPLPVALKEFKPTEDNINAAIKQLEELRNIINKSNKQIDQKTFRGVA